MGENSSEYRAQNPAPVAPRGGVLLYALGIGNGSDFDLIH